MIMAQERTDQGVERLLPQAIDVEKAVLGAMLLSKEAIVEAVEVLDESCFYRDAHRKIYLAILTLFDRDEPADQVTVTEELLKRKQLEEVGGAFYLASLASGVSTTANVTYHAKIILEKALLRKMIHLASQTTTECYEGRDDVFTILDRAEQRIFSLSERRLGRTFISLEEILRETFDELEKAHRREGHIVGIPTGYIKLDEMLTGFQPSDLIVLAARPSMGKTALALNIARNAAVLYKHPVAIFSLEMSSRQLAQRLLCAEASVDSHRVRSHRLPDEDWGRLSTAVGRLADAPIFIDDTPALGVFEMRAKARRLQVEHGIKLVIIDYLQLMSSPPRMENRQQEISFISRSLKALSKELNVPVLALSQLSRAVESRTDKRPLLSDLRESGSIEQDSDVVIFIYRAEQYRIMEEKGESTEGKAEIIIGKQRNGPTGTVHLVWLDKYARFENPAFEQEEPF
jgi:replicative DNA helicase